MWYLSTRNQKIQKTPSQAVLQGIADDGGLYMPESFENAKFPMENLLKLSNKEISATVLSLLFSGDNMFSENEADRFNEALNAVSRAYDGRFDGEDFAPLSKVGDGRNRNFNSNKRRYRKRCTFRLLRR